MARYRANFTFRSSLCKEWVTIWKTLQHSAVLVHTSSVHCYTHLPQFLFRKLGRLNELCWLARWSSVYWHRSIWWAHSIHRRRHHYYRSYWWVHSIWRLHRCQLEAEIKQILLSTDILQICIYEGAGNLGERHQIHTQKAWGCYAWNMTNTTTLVGLGVHIKVQPPSGHYHFCWITSHTKSFTLPTKQRPGILKIS
jgi:hypothetical protein